MSRVHCEFSKRNRKKASMGNQKFQVTEITIITIIRVSGFVLHQKAF